MAYNPRTAVRRFGLTPEEEAMRAPVSLPLAGPLPAGLADDITDATVRGVRADQRAASTDAATSALTGQPPIIDLGDDAEFIIPREDPSNLFGLADDGTRTADYRPGRDGPILPATVLPNYVPGQPRGDTVLLSNVQPSPSGAPASRNLSSLPVTPMSRWRTAAGHYNLDPRNAGLADDDVDATGANEDRFIDRTRAAEGRSMSPVGTFTEPMVRGRASRSIARLPGGGIATPTSPSQSMDLGSPTMTRLARSTNPYTLPRLGLEFAATTPESRLVDFAGLADDDPDSVWTPQSYADGLTRVDPTTDADVSIDPDDEVIGGDIEAESENATDIDADADLEVSEPLDPRRRAKLFGPAPQTTEYEDAAIRRGRELDQRAARGQRIAAGVAGGLGLLGLLTGSDVATGLGQAAASAGGAIPTDVEEQMRARAEQRRVREQGGIDRENALVNADTEAMRQDQQDQLRMQAAQSDAAVNEARVAEMQREAQASELEQAARNGNAEGFRRFIRGRAEAIQHSGTHDPILDAIMDPTFQSINDPDLLRGMLNSIDAVDRRRGGKGAGGSGASEHTVTDPRTGITTTVRSGGGGQQQRPSPTGTPAPGAPRTGRPRPGAPSPAPAGTAPDAADPAPEQQYLDELRVMTEAYPDLREGEFDIARTAVMRNRLSISDLTSPDTRRRAAAQGVVRTAIRRYRVGTGADQARMQQQAQSTYATQVGGDVVMPETVDPVVFAPMAQRAEPVYQEYVAPFLQARRSLEAARRAGVGEAGILLALQGANNDSIANFVRERGVRDPNAARALQRLKNSASIMREMYGRTQSGAAISPTEWSQFQNIMGLNHLYLNGSAQFQAAMEDLEQNGRRVVSSRFTPAGEHARDYASYFYRSLAGATGGQ